MAYLAILYLNGEASKFFGPAPEPTGCEHLVASIGHCMGNAPEIGLAKGK